MTFQGNRGVFDCRRKHGNFLKAWKNVFCIWRMLMCACVCVYACLLLEDHYSVEVEWFVVRGLR